MTRSAALKQFKDRHGEEAEGLLTAFINGLESGVDEVMGRILTAFGEIADQAEKEEKQICVFFRFSLLRYDLLQDQARIRLDVMDGAWFLDREALYAELDLTFLFLPYFRWRAEMLNDIRGYMGKVNRYDVEDIVQEGIKPAIGFLSHLLRILFRSIEKQESFARIPKGQFWEICFGEYRDYSELIMQMNRDPRSEEEWIGKLQDDDESPGSLQFSWWYGAELSKGDCRGRNLDYIVFEECSLKGIDFSKAELIGARFLNCVLESCSFRQADLSQAELDGCRFTNCDFTDAGLSQAVFSPDGLEAEWFDDKQKEEMLIVEGAQA